MKILKYDLSGSCSSLKDFRELEQHGAGVVGAVSTASAVKVSTVISSEGVSYMAQSVPKYSLSLRDSSTAGSDTWHMLTCFHVKDPNVTAEAIQHLRDEYDRRDDVFCGSFLKNILLITSDPSLSDAVIELSRSWGCMTVYQMPEYSKEYSNITPGPYFFTTDGVFWAWRLFPDEQEAFVASTIPSQEDCNTYETVNAVAAGASGLSIAVPSRLYFGKSDRLPLAGLRVSVKDIFHLKGAHTGAGNRAYRRLYPVRDFTSAAVQKAIDQGAVIVGKVKTAEFAGSQEVIGDWCDYSYARNVRADGYLVSTGSSTGSASGLAAYPWLDFSIGSDAGGSIRDPSVVHGIYGFRPTHDGSPTNDAVLPCPIFQVPGYMGRSSAGMLDFGLNWLPPKAVSLNLRKMRIWFPPEYHADRSDVQSIAAEAVSRLANWLGVEICPQRLEDIWKIAKPCGASGLFKEYFNKTFMDVLKHEYWEYTATFRKDYQNKYNAAPYVCKVTQWLWSEGSSTTSARKQKALEKVTTHNEWLNSGIFGDLNALMVFPMVNLSHRDEYLGPPEKRSWDGFDSNLHASLAGLPNVTVPVGQCKVYSSICQRDVMIPVSLSIVSPKDTDTALLRLVHEFLEAAEMPTSVLTGENAFLCH